MRRLIFLIFLCGIAYAADAEFFNGKNFRALTREVLDLNRSFQYKLDDVLPKFGGRS